MEQEKEQESQQTSSTQTTTKSSTEEKRARFFRRLKLHREKYWWDRKAARDGAKFFAKQLVHVEGAFAGHPFVLERWQRRIVRRAFGWKRRDSQGRKQNIRKYRVIFIFIPRKNGKSTLGAGFALKLLVADNEMGAQVVSAAAEREQAAVVFETAKRMVLSNPLFAKAGAVALRKAIPVYATGSTYKVLSAEAFSKHGKNLHGILFDELHAQPNRELVDVLKTSTGSRVQPLEVYFTTAGHDRDSICWEYYDYAKKVQDGIIEDETFLPVIYEAEEKDDWREESTWRKANPNLGVSISLDYLQRECKKAQEVPAYENTFKRLHLNMWTEQDVRLIPMDTWRANTAVWDEVMLFKRPCYAAVDLAYRQDICALELAFPVEDGHVAVLSYLFMPEEGAKKRAMADWNKFGAWVQQGYLITTPGDAIDYEWVRKKIQELGEKFTIKEIAIDPWHHDRLGHQLDGDGFVVVPYRQGFQSMSGPTKDLLVMIAEKKLDHGNHPVLTWMASNVAADTDAAGNLKPSKKRSKEKIDGIVALIMALGRLTLGEAEGDSVYTQRGFITVGR